MRWWYIFREWIAQLVFRGREDRALEEEMRFHIDMESRKLVASGLDEAEARRLAHLRFGGTDRARQRVREERGTRWLEDVGSDLRHGVRLLRRAPGFSAGAIAALALGIGASTAAWSLFDGVLLRPLPWADAHEIVELRELGEGRRFFPSYPNFSDWRDRSRTLSAVVASQTMGAHAIEGPSGPARAQVLAVTRGFFETIGLPLTLGRAFTDVENVPGGPPVVMVSHAFWRTQLGAPPDLSGARVRLFGEDREVVGVAPADHRFVVDGDILYPAEQIPGTVRGAHAYRVFGRLGEGVDVERAREELDGIAAAIQEEFPGESQAERVEVRVVQDVLLGPQRRPLGLLLGAAALVLLVVAVNVGSMVLARGTDRLRELGVRSSLGASRGRITRQLLFESLCLSVVGGVLGVATAWALVRGAAALAPEVIPRIDAASIDMRVLAFAVVVTLGTTLLFGLVPALRLSAAAPRVAGAARGTTRGARGWGLLLAVESSLAVVLLVGAALMLATVGRIVSAPPNWDPEGVLEVAYGVPNGLFQSEAEFVAFVEGMIEEAGAVSGVESVGVANFTPLGAGNYTAPASDPTRAENPENYSGWRVVSEGYFDALRIPIVRGRAFAPDETDAALVNAALAARLWPGEDPIGKLVTNNFHDGDPFRVVGVVADAGDWRWNGDDQTEMYVPWRAARDPEFVFNMRLLVRSADGDPQSIGAAVGARLREFAPRVPWDVGTLSGALGDTAADRRFLSAVLATFAGAGGVVALVGIFGVVAYTVGRRRRELGVRMALGARGSRVRSEILGGLAASIVPGVIVGLVVAAALSRLLAALLWGVSPLDPRVYGGVALVFMAAALLAGDVPARLGARTDPAVVLREE
ncbi:ADOP family duplicated permease [Gaopeijia maritima]|uniref:ADOP family duplicated permease n=1 Tax=Gaopeijia maritima TaxID=3119007 RepID=UPI00327D1ADD